MESIEKMTRREPWVSDQGDGTFINPVLHADYSDPDVIRVGDDFYMTASSFGHIPGLPILHSKDLINWRIINHAIQRMPLEGYERPQHGNGVWAPSIRYHAGKYWIFYGDPDVGIMMCTAEDPAGQWSGPHLVQEGKGLIDPCPFWDDDGQAYLVHAFARSRAGIKHILRMCRMAPDGSRLLDEGQIIYDGTEHHPTMEGPKMYKRGGYYYIFAPAGGVATGWQTILRSKSVFGPYEDRIVLHQGDSPVNGPHQGGWVELESGESWFMHFQDKDAYGRIVHLQPMHWENDWPVMGEDRNGDGIGEPVMRYRKPDVGKNYPVETPAASDEFDAAELGLQWQWQANPKKEWYELGAGSSDLRLNAQAKPHEAKTIYEAPHLLLQKFPADTFSATMKLDGNGLVEGDRAGIIVFGYSYAYLALVREVSQHGATQWVLVQADGNAEQEQEKWRLEVGSGALYLRVTVDKQAGCTFAYSLDGDSYNSVQAPVFKAVEGHWVGAKMGLFALHAGEGEKGGYADADWFRVTPPLAE
ncbi:glycoside hydrolase 43 family protein [Marinicrinis lubricantis]|uniref:Glycoside hydrolase 43 family protein n=1 Tax=Marinicrinis lubricantis TaxID=2086470 RepID=A0ABW1IJJ6_9BACL